MGKRGTGDPTGLVGGVVGVLLGLVIAGGLFGFHRRTLPIGKGSALGSNRVTGGGAKACQDRKQGSSWGGKFLNLLKEEGTFLAGVVG